MSVKYKKCDYSGSTLTLWSDENTLCVLTVYHAAAHSVSSAIFQMRSYDQTTIYWYKQYCLILFRLYINILYKLDITPITNEEHLNQIVYCVLPLCSPKMWREGGRWGRTSITKPQQAADCFPGCTMRPVAPLARFLSGTTVHIHKSEWAWLALGLIAQCCTRFLRAVRATGGVVWVLAPGTSVLRDPQAVSFYKKHPIKLLCICSREVNVSMSVCKSSPLQWLVLFIYALRRTEGITLRTRPPIDLVLTSSSRT